MGFFADVFLTSLLLDGRGALGQYDPDFFEDKGMRVNIWLQVHLNPVGFFHLSLWSMFGKWQLDREGLGRRCWGGRVEWEGSESSLWGHAGNGVQPSSLPVSHGS